MKRNLFTILLAFFVVLGLNAQKADFSKVSGETSGIKIIECAAGAIISNAPGDQNSAGTSNSTANGGAGYKKAAQVTNWTHGDLASIRVFAGQLFNDGSWSSCDTDPFTFNIVFYQDNSGLPGAEISTYTATLNHVSTGDYLFDNSAYGFMYYWDWTPATAISGLPETFWFTFQNTENDCWFMWLNTPSGTGIAAGDDGSGWALDPSPLQYCLTNVPADPLSPNVPTGVTVVPDAGGALTVQLDWTNPALDVNGDALAELTSMDVYLDGDAVAIYTNAAPTIGGADSYTATVAAGGNHTFKIVGTNAAGEGLPVETTVFVGTDVAVTATNVPPLVLLNETFIPTVTVINNGVGDQTFDVTLSDGDAYSNVVSVTNLASGATQELTFPEWNASAAEGNFTFTATAADPGSDFDMANNVATATLSVIDMLLFDFEADDQGWTFGGEFERAAPTGLGGEHGNPDPAAAFAGTNCIGTDLTGLGANAGDYEANLGERADYAISPVIDCSAETTVTIKFQQYLNVESPAYDHAYIDISVDGGTSWNQIWTNDSAVGDNAWHEVEFDISAQAAGQATVQIRFANGTTDDSWFFSGWNIDNFMINGQLVPDGYNVTFNVNMADSIASGYFVEGTDQLWLGSSINSWTTPGDDAAYEMTESGTNDVYTVTLNGIADGSYEYKYFKIVGGASSWDNGEWNGGSNRAFTVAGADMTLNDVYGAMTGIEELTAKGISVYPNPSNGTFNINVEDNFNLEIFDITGKVINTRVLNGNTTLQINNAGVYFLRFSNEQGSVTQKVIVQ